MSNEEGFINNIHDTDISRKILAINDGRDARNTLLALFGPNNLPTSVMKAKKVNSKTVEIDEAVQKRGYVNSSKRSVNGELNRYPKDIKKAAMVSGGYGCSGGLDGGALSTFPQNIGRTIVLLYSLPSQVVFDPFAGHNSRMELCINAGRNYVGCDISKEFMIYNNRRAEKLRKKHPDLNIILHHCDSRKVPVKPISADFTITSPPYWNIEYYGDEPEQLGKSQTYEEFLEGLGLVMKENFRVLRPGSFSAWFINDFRKKGKMYFYHIDVIKLGEWAGFIAHDILIVDLGRAIRDLFLDSTYKTKIIPKRHEYGIIFKKPLEDNKTNTKKKSK